MRMSTLPFAVDADASWQFESLEIFCLAPSFPFYLAESVWFDLAPHVRNRRNCCPNHVVGIMSVANKKKKRSSKKIRSSAHAMFEHNLGPMRFRDVGLLEQIHNLRAAEKIPNTKVVIQSVGETISVHETTLQAI